MKNRRILATLLTLFVMVTYLPSGLSPNFVAYGKTTSTQQTKVAKEKNKYKKTLVKVKKKACLPHGMEQDGHLKDPMAY